MFELIVIIITLSTSGLQEHRYQHNTLLNSREACIALGVSAVERMANASPAVLSAGFVCRPPQPPTPPRGAREYDA